VPLLLQSFKKGKEKKEPKIEEGIQKRLFFLLKRKYQCTV